MTGRTRRGGMTIVCVASSKGGSGKSTLAACLGVKAAEDGRCCIVDTDPQGSLVRWYELRGKGDAPGVVEAGSNLEATLEKLERAGVEFAIIETPPALIGKIEVAIAAADFVLIPSQASALDVEGVAATVELARQLGRPFAFVLNRVEPRSKLTAEAEAYLKVDGRVLEGRIGNRECYRAAMTSGRAGPETKDASARAAREEIDALWTAVKKMATAAVRKARA